MLLGIKATWKNIKIIYALDVCCSGWLERRKGNPCSIPEVKAIGYKNEGENY